MRAGSALLLAVLGVPSGLPAHEYWLDPLSYQLHPGTRLEADIRNGEDFVGAPLPFNPDTLRLLHRDGPDGRRTFSGRLGDYPALAAIVENPGLHVIALSTDSQFIEYPDVAAFRQFLHYHGLDHIVHLHAERGLPTERIIERFSRFAKALVQVGPPAGGSVERALAAQGLDFELLAATSPYRGQSTLELSLTFTGRPLADAQVEVFHARPQAAGAGTVGRNTLRTDDTGRVSIDIATRGKYLVNAVQLLTPPAGSPAHWRSVWTSLTFEVP